MAKVKQVHKSKEQLVYEAEEKKLREDAMKKLSSYITNASSCYINLTGTINQFGNAVGNIRGGRHIIISG